MINVWIDEFTPCLKDSLTGELVQTEVIRIVRKSFLRKYNEKNGWYVNWSDLLEENEVYALVVEGSVDIQGLVAVSKNEDMKACYVCWMCASPENNKEIAENVKYTGIGGHLFAIAAKKSCDFGYDGLLTGFAANWKALNTELNFSSTDYESNANLFIEKNFGYAITKTVSESAGE